LWLGRDASERALKEEALSSFAVLHFAAHAVVDEERADRSAILLTPGAQTEDGLLQSREIVRLDVQGAIVVLSACRSAGGSIVGGEGPISLARAFLQAGAHAVLASLRPIRDDDAALLVGSLSRYLAQGDSVAGALQAARREMIRDGVPTESWAGLVLVGDGGLVPFPGGSRTRAIRPELVGAVAASFLLVVLFVALRHFRK